MAGYSFSQEDKEVREFSESMPFGVSKVQFTGAMIDQTDDGKDFITVGVVNPEGVEDEVRLWFVGGATNISFNTLRQIIVHNAGDEAKKEKARKLFDNAKDTEEIVNLMEKVLEGGGEFWYTKYYDAKGRTYTNDHGTFKSINKNIHGYEPKVNPALMPQPKAGSEEVTTDNVKEFFSDMGPSEDVPTSTIPDKW